MNTLTISIAGRVAPATVEVITDAERKGISSSLRRRAHARPAEGRPQPALQRSAVPVLVRSEGHGEVQEHHKLDCHCKACRMDKEWRKRTRPFREYRQAWIE